MGHRFELYVDPEIANDIIDVSQQFNIEAKIIGHCDTSTQKKVTVRSQNVEFVYQ
jgi:phosphoribosylformylglycinamidine cyclo-ligase